MTTATRELDLDGPAAPPRSNGELVFTEPWEGRAFGLAMALTERGVVSYEAFRAALIASIAGWEGGQHEPGEPYSYYRCWLQALEQVLADEDLVGVADVAGRAASYALRPAGHDHGHGHGHDHDH